MPQAATPGLPRVMGLLQLGFVSLLVGDRGLLKIEALTLSAAGFVNKKLSHSWIIVEHQVKVQKKTHGYDMLFSCSISWSSSFEAKKNTPCLCSDSLLQNRFPLHPPVQAHKVLLGNRLGGVLCEGFICRLGTLRSRLQALSALTG